ncbi:MAG: glycosyltransferase family 4 protein [Limisphaerales bacterium]
MDSTSISGVLKHYAYMANEWIKLGHHTDFLVAKAGFSQFQALAPEAGLVSSDNLFDATKHLSNTWSYFPAYGWRCLTAHVGVLPRRYDVIYASGQFIVDIYCARVMALRNHCPWVAKIQHVLASQHERGGFINDLFLRTERLAARWMNEEAGAVMCLSQTVQDDYRQLEANIGLNPMPTFQVGCGVDIEALLGTPQQDKIYDLAFMGRMHEQKGVFELPDFWQLLLRGHPQARMIVIGEGPHRAAMEAMFRERNLADSVTFTGGIAEEEKNKLLRQARVGLSLSHEEGWGLSITEFLALGLPVVAYELPVFQQVFPDQLNLVNRGDITSAVEQALALLQDRRHLQRRARTGSEFVQRYDYRQIAREELDVLSNVAALRHAD